MDESWEIGGRKYAAPASDGAVGCAVDLAEYDLIVLSTSGGKDSAAAMHHVAELAEAAGVTDRLSAVHADLGRVEWPGVTDKVREQCARYAIPVAIVSKVNTEAAPADMLERVAKRGAFPDAARRWCTSDYKRGPIRREFTALAAKWKAANPDADRPARILSIMGMRAEESPARAKRPTFVAGVISTRNQQVDEWLPIHGWTESEVWAAVEDSGVARHWAYGAGMPRLSCSFCVLGSRSSLVRAAQLRPDLAAEFVAAEAATGHTFQQRTSMADIVAEAAALDGRPALVADWVAA